MGDWEDKLIEEIKRVQKKASSGSSVSAPKDPLAECYEQIVAVFEASIGRISVGLGLAPDKDTGTSDRRRWTYGARALALRFDRAAAKIFVTIDVGTDLAFEELTLSHCELVDQRGKRVVVDELSQRFVSRLFRGR